MRRPSSSGSLNATNRSSSYTSSNSDSGEEQEDLKKPNKLRSSIIQSVISEARSLIESEESVRPSIAKPSRPYTPRDCERRLFIENEYNSRPTSAISVSSSHFDFSHRNLTSTSRDDNQEVTRVNSGSRKKKPSSSGSKRTGSSKSSRSDPNRDEPTEQGTSDKVWNAIEAILSALESCQDEDTLMDSLDSLFLLVDKLKTSQNSGEDEKKLNFVAKLSQFIDIENGPRTVKCCSIILKVSNYGHQILHTCKILFKISKQEKNDKIFKDDHIIAPLVKLLYQEFTTDNFNTSWEILLFSIGTLKNISYDSFNQKLLIKHNTISLLSLLLSSALRELKTGNLEKVNKQAQLLVQIMATLRNLAMKTGTFKQFLEYNVIDNIHILMNALMSHSEFIHNSTRVLSKLSLDELCTEELRKISTLKSCLINVMKEHKKHKPIVVRVTFILGNITFQDYTEQELFDERTEIPFLLDLLDLYSVEDEKNASENVKKETEDLLTKLIRLIANISMDEHQGKLIAKSKQVTRLIELIERKKVAESEELILNTLRCITNLSFYAFSDTASPLYTFRVKLSSLLSPLLFHDLPDVVYEATRTFGNLSQDADVRAYITKARIDEVLIIMVEHGNTDIVYAVCGVLVNITSDPSGIKAIQEHGAIEKLLDVLDKSSVSLALIILKIIHNICLNNEAYGNISKIYSDYDLEHLDMLLNDILNHEYEHQDMNEQDVSMLRDLSSVAQELQYILSK